MNRTHYAKVWFGFSVIFVLVIVMVLPHPSLSLTPNQLQMKNQIQKDIKKLEAQKDILIKRMQGYNKMRRKWKNDLDIWRSRYNNLIKNKSRYVQKYGEDYYRQNMAKAFNNMKHCQDRYNDLNGIIFELGRQVSAIDNQVAVKNGQLAQLGSKPETSGSTVAKTKDQKSRQGSTGKGAAAPSLFGETFK